MATFPSINPTYRASKRSQPTVRNVQFGDGYSQRLRFGLNTDLKVWSLKFEVSETDTDTIETFLRLAVERNILTGRHRMKRTLTSGFAKTGRSPYRI